MGASTSPAIPHRSDHARRKPDVPTRDPEHAKPPATARRPRPCHPAISLLAILATEPRACRSARPDLSWPPGPPARPRRAGRCAPAVLDRAAHGLLPPVHAPPQARPAGLKPGDRWCLRAPRWQGAFEAGCAPRVALEDLGRHAARNRRARGADDGIRARPTDHRGLVTAGLVHRIVDGPGGGAVDGPARSRSHHHREASSVIRLGCGMSMPGSAASRPPVPGERRAGDDRRPAVERAPWCRTRGPGRLAPEPPRRSMQQDLG